MNIKIDANNLITVPAAEDSFGKYVFYILGGLIQWLNHYVNFITGALGGRNTGSGNYTVSINMILSLSSIFTILRNDFAQSSDAVSVYCHAGTYIYNESGSSKKILFSSYKESSCFPIVYSRNCEYVSILIVGV